MKPPDPRAITVLINRMSAGDAAAAEELLPQLYAQLHEIAEGQMRDRGKQHTLQPTALVHEAWMRLTRGEFVSREHFAAVAAKAMRSVLLDHARSRGREKRGGSRGRVPFDDVLQVFDESGPDLLALDDALQKLAQTDPELARIVELRFFGGLTIEDTASAMGCSTATVKRGWRVARMWLERELEGTET